MIISFYALDYFISKINFKTYRAYALTGYMNRKEADRINQLLNQ